MDGASFALGVRNSHSKQFRLSIVVGLRIFVCSNLSFAGDFKHRPRQASKNFLLKNAISIASTKLSADSSRCRCRLPLGRRSRSRTTKRGFYLQGVHRKTISTPPKHLARECGGTGGEPAYEEFDRGRLLLQKRLYQQLQTARRRAAVPRDSRPRPFFKGSSDRGESAACLNKGRDIPALLFLSHYRPANR